MDASTFAETFNKRTLLQVLLEHPHWSLTDLCKHVTSGGRLADELGALTLGEIREHTDDPHQDQRRHAERLRGPDFDALVLEIIRNAGKWVQTSYLRERVGGPPWKLQATFKRLVKAGAIEREGKSSNTQYRAPQAASGSDAA